MLLEKLSDKIIIIFLENNIITEEEKSDFLYGIEISLLFIFDVLSLILIGAITGHLLEIFFFTMGFTPLKVHAGGYHAKTPLQCVLIYIIVVYLSIVVTQSFMNSIIFQICILAGLVISSIILIKFAPAESINKPLCQEQKRHNRTCTFLTFSIQCMLIIMALIFHTMNYYMFLFIIGIVAESVSLLIKERGETHEKANAYDGF